MREALLAMWRHKPKRQFVPYHQRLSRPARLECQVSLFWEGGCLSKTNTSKYVDKTKVNMAQEMLKNYLSKDEMRSPSSFREQRTKRKKKQLVLKQHFQTADQYRFTAEV